MTFNPVTPNAAQSPGLFPAQNNTNFTRLKTIINTEHVFNDTAQVDDGAHRQVTLVNRTAPGSVPVGTNSMVYGFLASDSVNELWFYDSVTSNQLNWREKSGTVVVGASYVTITTIPTNCFGNIFLFVTTPTNSRFIQTGSFVSDGTVVNGYSDAQKFFTGQDATQILRLAFDGAGASGLNLRVICDISGFNGYTWTYRLFYRKYA